MKRILLSLVVSVVALSAAALYTRAAWTDAVTITNNQISTGTVDLWVSTDNVPGPGTWATDTEVSSMVLSDLVPGAAATEAYSFSLLNSSSPGTDMALTAQITASGILPTAGVDKTQLMIELYDTDTTLAESAEVSLAAWEAGAQALTTNLATGITRNYGVRARLLGSALNEWQGQTVTFTLTVTGSQP